MIDGIMGRKRGMTQIFAEDGAVLPVTVIEVPSCIVAQLRTAEKDGYTAVQVGTDVAKEKHIGKPRAGHCKKLGIEPMRRLREFRVDSLEGMETGQAIKVEDVFVVGQRVDVSGTSKGKGFQGTVKRHNFSRGDMSHGGMSRRRPGSIGQCATPSRVFKGHRMSGHMGDRAITMRNLELVAIDTEHQLLLVRGAVPGAVNAQVIVRRTTKGVRVPKYKTA
jgi:large subunit ribosomal protein L3